jgi:predicted HNH restriction endonuclease
MKAVQKGDRLFICATSADELYLLGLLQVRKVVKERSSRSRAEFGDHQAICRNLSGSFKILPLGKRKWHLRFVNTQSDRLDPAVTLALQVRSHRFLSDESADLLTKMLGEEVASVERECRFLEGERRAAQTARSVRNAALRVAAKRRWGTRCYCCGFSFEEFYGPVGEDFAIVHHLDPLGNSDGRARETSVEDVRIVCANCHFILHRENPPLGIDELRRRIGKRWTVWSVKGVETR